MAGVENLYARRNHADFAARMILTNWTWPMSAPARMIIPPTSISICAAVAISTKSNRPSPPRRFSASPFKTLRRQPNSCEGASPASRAMAETFAPGASDASIRRAFASSDHRRCDRGGLTSRRSGTASMTWKFLASFIGADKEVDTVSSSVSWPIRLCLAHSLTRCQMGPALRLHMERARWRPASNA